MPWKFPLTPPEAARDEIMPRSVRKHKKFGEALTEKQISVRGKLQLPQAARSW
jgi:hypothetical protein